MTVPSSAALRMRRSRDRRRQGDVIVSLEVAPKVTADLVELGWVPAHVCGDKDVLAHALTELVERAIEVRVTPALSSPGKVSFMLEIQRSTIDTLVELRWLRADQQDDLGRDCDCLPPFRRPIARHCA